MGIPIKTFEVWSLLEWRKGLEERLDSEFEIGLVFSQRQTGVIRTTYAICLQLPACWRCNDASGRQPARERGPGGAAQLPIRSPKRARPLTPPQHRAKKTEGPLANRSSK
jgi:hypothetical protein